MKKSLATLWLVAWLAVSWAPKANAQIDKNSNETQHQIENVFNQQKNENSNDTILYKDAMNLSWVEDITYEELISSLKDSEFIDELLNNENFKNYVKEYNYNKEELKKIINDTITNEETMNLIENTIKDESTKDMIRNWDLEALQKKVEELEKNNNKQDKALRYLGITAIILWASALSNEIDKITERRKKRKENKK